MKIITSNPYDTQLKNHKRFNSENFRTTDIHIANRWENGENSTFVGPGHPSIEILNTCNQCAYEASCASNLREHIKACSREKSKSDTGGKMEGIQLLSAPATPLWLGTG